MPAPGGDADTHLLVVRDKVQRYLADMIGTVQLTADSALTFQSGSARVFVRCLSWGEGNTVVSISAAILFSVKPSPELYEHIATHSDDYLFGHLTAVPQSDGTVTVTFNHNLLGDYIDPEELKFAVGGVVSTADELDDTLKARFGGTRFHDDVS